MRPLSPYWGILPYQGDERISPQPSNGITVSDGLLRVENLGVLGLESDVEQHALRESTSIPANSPYMGLHLPQPSTSAKGNGGFGGLCLRQHFASGDVTDVV